jgi:hypothetical protein
MKKLENSGKLLKAAVPDKEAFEAGMYATGGVYWRFRWIGKAHMGSCVAVVLSKKAPRL